MNLSNWSLLRSKDRSMRSVFDGLLSGLRPDIICDVGSYDGNEAARFAQIVPSADIFAFEGSPINIERYIRSRPELARVVKENVAVSDVDGEVTFHIVEADGGADWREGANSLNERTDGIASRPITVPSVRLDSYFATQVRDGKTFGLWIDVEGALDRVLEGARNVLGRTLILRTEIESTQYWKDQKLSGEITKQISDAGFILLGDTHTEETGGQSDVLFLNRSWLELTTRVMV